jgi:hypothetical protein
VASVTSWNRLEPHPREGSLQRSLQAQLRDPLWLLARQWQLAEFAGEDAGSPVQATMTMTSRPITHYALTPDGSGLAPLDGQLPLEAHVERESAVLNVRGAAQLGRHFEAAVRAGGVPSADAVIAAFRAAYPIAPAVAPDAPEDERGRAMRAMLAARVVDGVALASAAAVAASGGIPSPALPAEASAPGMPAVLADLIAFRAATYSEPTGPGDTAWRSRQLDYAFSAASETSAGTTALVAPEFPGGSLDWHAFTLGAASTATGTSGQPGAPPSAPPPQPPPETTEAFNFLPMHVTFRGMPPPRWWEFEDALTDIGALQPDTTDLAAMLVMEFALVFGNDWFYVPAPADTGSLSQVTALVVSDTFGYRTLIPPAERAGAQPVSRPWSMFKVTGGGARSEFLVVPPACGTVVDGPALEDVYFLRDDMAALAWAVEHVLQGPMDTPVDAAQLAREHDAALPPPPAPSGPDISYVLETTVPDNWIPLVPAIAPSGARYFRRGVMVRPGYGDMHAHAVVLQPGQPLFVADEEVSEAGAQVRRYFRRARRPDGGTVLWMARQTTNGRGPGWSGLVYDQVRSGS